MANDTKRKKNQASLTDQAQKKSVKFIPEEEVKHIPKVVIEQRFMEGHLLSPNKKMGQRAADITTKWVGSWIFIGLIFLMLAIWMSLNLYLASTAAAWDPYPFILLNFVLSCLAAVQAPIILMSQNRQNEHDRMVAARDFAVDRKSEKEVGEIKKDLDDIKSLLRKAKK